MYSLLFYYFKGVLFLFIFPPLILIYFKTILYLLEQVSTLYLSPTFSFLSPLNLIKTFILPSDKLITVFIQEFSNRLTSDYIISTYQLQYSYIKEFNASSIFLDCYETIELLSNDYALYSSISVPKLKEISNAENLISLYPEYTDIFEFFEVLSINVDNSLYAHLSLPPVKLYYPEPFVASPTFVHEEFWFIHILHYQHWLWFFFISLIMLYFITFINVVRWCNPRNKPKRETRGVSRSKCADLITACVPVSWAIAIIVSETVDAADYYDGFGTGEVIIGIRAYQWGWLYYFPKNIDVNYDYSPNYTSVTGNSLKYSKYSTSSSHSISLWNSKLSNSTISHTNTPSHLVLSPSDNDKILNFINFNSLGTRTLKDVSAFRAPHFSSKSNLSNLFNSQTNYAISYSRLSNLYLNDVLLQDSANYTSTRQYHYPSKTSTESNYNLLVDSSTINTLHQYNLGQNGNLNNLLSPNINAVVKGSVSSDNPLNPQITNPLSPFHTKNELDSSGLMVSNFTSPLLLDLVESTTSDSKLNPIKSTDNAFNRYNLKSPNQQLLTFETNIRNIENLHPFKSSVNRSIADQTTLSNILLSPSYSVSSVIDESSTTLSAQHTPTLYNSLGLVSTSYDKITQTNPTPEVLISKDSDSLPFFFETSWATIWSNSNATNRYFNLNNYNNVLKDLIVPLPHRYVDYDFRSWKLLELLEDLFWESSYSYYTQDEYRNYFNSISNLRKLSKREAMFHVWDNNYYGDGGRKYILNIVNAPFIKSVNSFDYLTILPTHSDDLYLDSKLLNTLVLNIYNSEVEVDLSEGIYSASKNNEVINLNSQLSSLNSYLNLTTPTPSNIVLNFFRVGFEEPQLGTTPLLDYNTETNSPSLSNTLDTRLHNTMRLRQPTKSITAGFNALQKVFRPRFDQGKSHAKISDLSNSELTYPLLSEKRVKYEKLLGKNFESYFDSLPYKVVNLLVSDITNPLTNSNNVYFSNIPFLLSYTSDMIKYIWFDHQSRWASLEVQPSSVARYSLGGLPFFSKNFELNSDMRGQLRESSNYVTRLSKARKNYISNWSTSPYLYSRLSSWYLNNNISFELYNLCTLKSTLVNLKLSEKYWNNNWDLPTLRSTTLSLTDMSTPGRSAWKPSIGTASYMYNTVTLGEILSKREYLYSQYFLKKGGSIYLPESLRATPSNTLFKEVQKVYKFIEPSSFISEVSRDLFYVNSISNLNNLFDKVIEASTPFSLGYLFKNLFYYSINSNLHYSDKFSNSNLKDQFRPMRKGVSNMIRLQATGAIAMPTEIRVHILASSRDIIHSWGIPSAGIKIDCIPGYSSHRVAIFLNSGIFWGQCYEICGRFHHWMPIIVHFMRKDLFFLWSDTFILRNTAKKNSRYYNTLQFS